MDTRHNQLVLISKKVESANDKINEILSRLGWTRSELTQWQTKKQDSTRPNKRNSAKTVSKQVCHTAIHDWIHGSSKVMIRCHYRASFSTRILLQ